MYSLRRQKFDLDGPSATSIGRHDRKSAIRPNSVDYGAKNRLDWRTLPILGKPVSGSASELWPDDPKPDVVCAEIAFLELARGSAVAGAVIGGAEE